MRIKWKKIGLVLFLAVLFAAPNVYAGRETLLNPPQQINCQSGDTPYAFRIENAYPFGTRRFEIKCDGTIAIFNASGDTVYALDGSGKPLIGSKSSAILIDTEAEAEAAVATYDVWIVNTTTFVGYTDTVIAGVSVYLPTGSAALDGFSLKVTNLSTPLSATTDVLLVPANDIYLGAGITDWIRYAADTGTTRTPDGQALTEPMANINGFLNTPGETITLDYVYGDASGGTWYVSGITQ